jgi:hypothetical protein
MFDSAMGQYAFVRSYLGFLGFCRPEVMISCHPSMYTCSLKVALNTCVRYGMRMSVQFFRTALGISSVLVALYGLSLSICLLIFSWVVSPHMGSWSRCSWFPGNIVFTNSLLVSSLVMALDVTSTVPGVCIFGRVSMHVFLLSPPELDIYQFAIHILLFDMSSRKSFQCPSFICNIALPYSFLICLFFV